MAFYFVYVLLSFLFPFCLLVWFSWFRPWHGTQRRLAGMQAGNEGRGLLHPYLFSFLLSFLVYDGLVWRTLYLPFFFFCSRVWLMMPERRCKERCGERLFLFFLLRFFHTPF
ncbi:hypothetical protein B0T19DRAFT_77050 [Cercophora scortea]|uniref:Uncharacterized protein n=1 Tax=Cercophora scortea TaxID=314031 RepID=A0AAE0J6K2_9PEZI|nr:hypothetical protein B0T19DRAFT_77050 [Cercophora scortea]